MSKRVVEIDSKSGFCFGVVKAIEAAEQGLANHKTLFSLGDIVHNHEEVDRLSQLGLQSTSTNDFETLKGSTVLIRAHGEPPSTYKNAKDNNITLIDATCPVVLKLQRRVKEAYLKSKEIGGCILIYGKKGHAEVNGLVGQTNGEAIVIESVDDLEGVNFTVPLFLFAQTTKGIESFNKLVGIIKERISDQQLFEYHDTICRQVANRVPHVEAFAKQHDVIVFVGGLKSSNAQVLFSSCQKVNEKSYFVSNASEIKAEWFGDDTVTIGVCGATSTPRWLMEQVAKAIEEI